MKRFSRRSFSQIMLSKKLKLKLDKLKYLIGKEISATWNPSYNDVISYLIDEYTKSRKTEYQLEEKLIVASSIKPKLTVAIPLKKIYQTNLEQKKLVSFNLES